MIRQKESRDEFAQKNLGLVHLCARKFIGRGIEYDDLYSTGCVGLIKAIDAFDENRGVQFSTYAVPVILGEIKRLFRDGGAIKVSRSLKELSIKVNRMREELSKKLNREPIISEIAKELAVSEEQIVEAINASAPPLSLTIEESDGENKEYDVLVENPEEKISDRLSLAQVLNKLEEKEKKLILLRYFNEKTQVETAKELDMTQVQISRKEKKILQILREYLV